MWSPTHVHVIVHRAEGLVIKGKNGTNNAFVVIELGKETYRTSIKEKSGKGVLWNEECELKIPKTGNSACVFLTAYHRNSLSLDQFLGCVKIPLISFDKLQRSVEWYKLEGKPGKDKGKDKFRGELEVEIGFTFKQHSQSLTSLQSKKKSSFEKLTGSLFGLRDTHKKRGIKKFANNLSRNILRSKKEAEQWETLEENHLKDDTVLSENCNNLDPGVISDDEDMSSHKSCESLTNSSDNPNTTAALSTPSSSLRQRFSKNPQISISNWEEGNKEKSKSFLNISQESVSSGGSKKQSPKLGETYKRLGHRRRSSSCVDFSLLSSPKPQKKFSSSLNLENSQPESHKRLSKLARKLRNFHSLDKKEISKSVENMETLKESIVPKVEFKNKNKDELINMVVDLQKRVDCVSIRVKDLEEYLDEILVKVMETVPKILEKSSKQ